MIEYDRQQKIYWLYEEGVSLAVAYVKRVGRQWWLGGMPAVDGYYRTKRAALEAAK